MKWQPTPAVKIYEALGAVADGRVEEDGNSAKVYSSSRNKFYGVSYDPVKKEIMANDNGSYWKGYLGYPAVAFLMKTGVLSHDQNIGDLLKNVPWKDINQRFKNDFKKALDFILEPLSENNREALQYFVSKVDREIKELDLNFLGDKVKPPEGY